jgi:hypothetical protein
MTNIRHDNCVNASESFNSGGENLLIGQLAGGISGDFADMLLIISGFAITLLFGVIYIEQIIAAANRLMKALNPLKVLTRFRLWRSAHKVPH